MRLLPFRAMALAGCAAALAVAGCAAPLAGDCTCPAADTPQRQAVSEAAVILQAFAPPPGARQVPASPVPSNPIDGTAAPLVPHDDDLVTDTSWWLVTGEPGQVIHWEAAHLPASYQFTGSSYPLAADGVDVGTWEDAFYLPDVPGHFDKRGLSVSTTPAGHGQTAIRVDAFVDWIPARAAGDTVPPTARVATLTEISGPVGGPAGGPADGTATQTVNLTDTAKVAELAAYLNGMQVNVPGAGFACPVDFVQSLTVTFRARVGGPVLAQASGDPTGCGLLSYTMPGRGSVGLGGGLAASALLAEIDQLAGLHWEAGPDGGPTER